MSGYFSKVYFFVVLSSHLRALLIKTRADDTEVSIRIFGKNEKCIHFNATAYKHRARWVHQQFNTGGEREEKSYKIFSHQQQKEFSLHD